MRRYLLTALCLYPMFALGQDITPVEQSILMNSQETTNTLSLGDRTLLDTAQSIYVIKGEEIRRMGFKHVAEALRLAPGVQVGRRDANKWSISIRGFQQENNNNILVMLDGQVMNNAFYGGTYWDTLDTIIDNIEKIEIIRGAQGVRLGSNALNGAINIITKNGAQTQGWLVNAGTGIYDREFDLRYGTQINDQNLRVYGRYGNFEGNKRFDSRDTGNGFHIKHLGMKLDGQVLCNPYDVATEWYHGTASSNRQIMSFTPAMNVFKAEKESISGGKFLVHTQSQITENERVRLQMGLLIEKRKGELYSMKKSALSFNADFYSHISENNYLDLGLGVRNDRDSLVRLETLTLTPQGESNKILDAYIQDEYHFTQKLRFNAGISIEQNDFTSFESQNMFKARYLATENESFWGSINTALRNPSRLEKHSVYNTNVFVPAAPVNVQVTSITGNPFLKAEEVRTLEFGYKNLILQQLNFEASVFSSQYARVILPKFTGVNTLTTPIVYDRTQFTYFNSHMIKTYGLELNGEWDVTDEWKLRSAYHYLGIENVFRHLSPRYQFNIRSLYHYCDNIDFTTAFFYVGKLPTQRVKDYMRVDASFGYKPVKPVELRFTVQNLTQSRHPEDNLPQFGVPSKQLTRSYYLSVTVNTQ